VGCNTATQTEAFLRDTAFKHIVVNDYCQLAAEDIVKLNIAANSYTDWIAIAKLGAALRFYAVKYGVRCDISIAD
jgi:hypothetical protein